MWLFKKSATAPGMVAVGFMSGDGSNAWFEEVEILVSFETAAMRVHYLNGGCLHTKKEVLTASLDAIGKNKLLSILEQCDETKKQWLIEFLDTTKKTKQ
jgi:hypothetical protein